MARTRRASDGADWGRRNVRCADRGGRCRDRQIRHSPPTCCACTATNCARPASTGPPLTDSSTRLPSHPITGRRHPSSAACSCGRRPSEPAPVRRGDAGDEPAPERAERTSLFNPYALHENHLRGLPRIVQLVACPRRPGDAFTTDLCARSGAMRVERGAGRRGCRGRGGWPG